MHAEIDAYNKRLSNTKSVTFTKETETKVTTRDKMIIQLLDKSVQGIDVFAKPVMVEQSVQTNTMIDYKFKGADSIFNIDDSIKIKLKNKLNINKKRKIKPGKGLADRHREIEVDSFNSTDRRNRK